MSGHTTTLEVQRFLRTSPAACGTPPAHADSGCTQVVSVLRAQQKLGTLLSAWGCRWWPLFWGKDATSLQDKGILSCPGFPRVQFVVVVLSVIGVAPCLSVNLPRLSSASSVSKSKLRALTGIVRLVTRASSFSRLLCPCGTSPTQRMRKPLETLTSGCGNCGGGVTGPPPAKDRSGRWKARGHSALVGSLAFVWRLCLHRCSYKVKSTALRK